MFLKDMRVSYLLDFYGDLLDEHTANVMKAYYNDDLSLSEVASDVGISRQGIRHLIKKGSEMLEFYDQKLQLSTTYKNREAACKKLSEIAANLGEENRVKEQTQLMEIVELLSKGN